MSRKMTFKNPNSFWGVVLVLIGGLMLLDRLDLISTNIWHFFWPVLLMAVGLAYLLIPGFHCFCMYSRPAVQRRENPE